MPRCASAWERRALVEGIRPDSGPLRYPMVRFRILDDSGGVRDEIHAAARARRAHAGGRRTVTHRTKVGEQGGRRERRAAFLVVSPLSGLSDPEGRSRTWGRTGGS